MSIDEKLVAKMAALIRTIGADKSADYYTDARDIAKLLPDPDLEAARKIAMSIPYFGTVSDDHFQAVFTKAAVAGIAHGRANP